MKLTGQIPDIGSEMSILNTMKMFLPEEGCEVQITEDTGHALELLGAFD